MPLQTLFKKPFLLLFVRQISSMKKKVFNYVVLENRGEQQLAFHKASLVEHTILAGLMKNI